MKELIVSERNLFSIAHALLPAFVEQHKNVLGGRSGLALVIHREGDDYENDLARNLGDLITSRYMEKLNFANRKIFILQQNPGCTTSFEQENIQMGIYGGGIRVRQQKLFIAVSGFPPHLDHKFVMLVLMTAEALCLKDYREIRESSFKHINRWRLENGEQELPAEAA